MQKTGVFNRQLSEIYNKRTAHSGGNIIHLKSMYQTKLDIVLMCNFQVKHSGVPPRSLDNEKFYLVLVIPMMF